MEFDARAGLLRIDLVDRTVRLCDGGFFAWDGGIFESEDARFGTIASVEALGEGRGDEIPAMQLDLYPPGTAAVADLSRPGDQTARVRFWTAIYSPLTGRILGNPELEMDGQIDQTTLSIGASRTLGITIVPSSERIFERDIGNSYNPGFHKSVWPGETGHDNATGLKVPVAWGVESPRQGSGGTNGRQGGRNGPRMRERY